MSNQILIIAHWCGCSLLQVLLAKLKKSRKIALRLPLDDYTKSYEELLEMADKPLVTIKIHRVLAIEIYKTLNSYNPGYMKDIFMKTL